MCRRPRRGPIAGWIVAVAVALDARRRRTGRPVDRARQLVGRVGVAAAAISTPHHRIELRLRLPDCL